MIENDEWLPQPVMIVAAEEGANVVTHGTTPLGSRWMLTSS